MILAGGLGLRMRPLTDSIPKPMIGFHGRPFLAYLVDQLRDAGIRRILMLLGYRSEVIQDHFGDGRAWGVSITYSITPPDVQTGTRVRSAIDAIDPRFLLLYCDNYWPLRLDDMWSRYSSTDAPAMTTVYRNGDRFSRDNIRVEDGRVVAYDPTRTAAGLAGVEIGYAILERAIVEELLPAADVSLESAIYPTLAARGHLLAYTTDHRYYGIGSMERLPTTAEFLARRPTILLDRDGVLNRKPARAEYVRHPDEFEWLEGALDGVRLLTESGFRLLVISNQAGVSRGAMTDDDLMAVDTRMTADAASAGGYIERAYYCRHDWDAGCECRKPKAGMLYQAQRDFHLDLSRTPYIGDDDRDGEAAGLAGAPFIQVTEDRPLLTIAHELTREAQRTP